MSRPAVIRKEHYYNHGPSVVWKCLTDPNLLARWFAPGDMKPVVGHRSRSIWVNGACTRVRCFA